MDTNAPSLSDSLTATAQAVGQKTKTAIDKVASNPKESAWIAGGAAVLYLASRVAGFKAGYEFAKKHP